MVNIRLNNDEIKTLCDEFGLLTPPILFRGNSFSIKTIGELLEMVKGNYEGTENPREGLVFRTDNCRCSFKVINNDYLLVK